jgi:Alw26I/Eco31I/Esp3I family type II restriction endonuclease
MASKPASIEPVDKSIGNNVAWESYEAMIMNHPNYNFLPKEHKKSWVCVTKKKGKNPRMQYWDQKKEELIDSNQILKESIPADVAKCIHPTKMHVCAKCGEESSIYYEYPNKNTWKWLEKTFGYHKNHTTQKLTIFEIYAALPELNKAVYFQQYFKMTIEELQRQCKNNNYTNTKLSPGVMSNAPDRLDGFHSYNSVCGCRSQHDKGRSTENMKSYTRDRRAYEYFSDGKCLLANNVMGKINTIADTCFICGNHASMTADHIGPISLGFIHDPQNFQGCCNTCNTTKNNRITERDVLKIKSLEEKGVCLVSWWAKDVWEQYKNNNICTIQDNMNKNTKKFLCIMEWLKMNKPAVLNSFITTIYMDHDKSYHISDISILPNGDITYQSTESISEKKTKDVQKMRTNQILMEVNKKNNRKVKINLSEKEIAHLSDITLDNFKNKIGTVLVGL